jgi:hypothetical protein
VSTTPVANNGNNIRLLILKVNLKEKIELSLNSTIKIFLIEDFLDLPPASTTPVVHLELQISTNFQKIETALMGYST